MQPDMIISFISIKQIIITLSGRCLFRLENFILKLHPGVQTPQIYKTLLFFFHANLTVQHLVMLKVIIRKTCILSDKLDPDESF